MYTVGFVFFLQTLFDFLTRGFKTVSFCKTKEAFAKGVLCCIIVWFFYAETATEQVHINATYQQIQFHTSGIQTECKYKSIILYIYLQGNLI